ncbi:hypothetical protein EW026_g6922 [Hermanssonia centrifuga]|uniref:Uncharacterized protein n=1 Tax=Hermanssonia centrifuga TaxID=98765 RepID=A0A4S4KB75_9APHY|nr:hypothetical protein EW026_g6922 [Hermanssonia centrifuga]
MDSKDLCGPGIKHFAHDSKHPLPLLEVNIAPPSKREAGDRKRITTPNMLASNYPRVRREETRVVASYALENEFGVKLRRDHLVLRNELAN